ncbi:guanylate kinase [Patescibacteria group bacterium]
MNVNTKPIIIIAGASGVGKTTIIIELLADKNLKLKRVKTSTIRPPRPGAQVTDRHFLTREDFETKIKKNEFLEHAVVFNNLCGVQKTDFEKVYNSENIPIFDVDIQGVRTLKNKLVDYPLLTFFIIYDSKESIKKRLLENPERRSNLDERVQKIATEEKIGKNLCKYAIENRQGKIEFAVNKIKDIISSR